jgi:hypothetical protein
MVGGMNLSKSQERLKRVQERVGIEKATRYTHCPRAKLYMPRTRLCLGQRMVEEAAKEHMGHVRDCRMRMISATLASRQFQPSTSLGRNLFNSFPSMSSRGGQSNTVPWSRLKTPTLDPLEALGLPSKGDNR